MAYGARDYAITPPVEGERVLFCEHADVDDDHIDISAKACPDQPFHWYFTCDGAVSRDGGPEFPVRWIAVCDACHRSRSLRFDQAFYGQDARWIGPPPVIQLQPD